MTKAHRHKAERQTLSAGQPAGQTMIFMLMALLILAVVIFWVFDVHNVMQLKARTQNTGDAAALAAARWQGITLNLIGDLHILQALALSRGDTNAAEQITAMQARLCYAGPLVALLASQQAAKNNRAYVNPEYTANLFEHADRVLSYYATDPARFPEPYTNAWVEYAEMLTGIAEQGLAAGPDNTRYFNDFSGDHWLLSRNFYEAVASSDWCWFYWHGLSTLQSYSGYQYWPDLPLAQPTPNTHNSEIFGLGLLPQRTLLPGGIDNVARMNQLNTERNLSAEIISNAAADLAATWYLYTWTDWSAISDNNFPILPLQVKPEYDYMGADAVTRVEAGVDPRMLTAFPALQPFLAKSSPSAGRLTQSNAFGKAVTWTAAGKPFGYLTVGGGSPVRPDAYAIVLPAFHNVRLIPVDAATGANISAYDLNWRNHTQGHLLTYMESGQAGLDASCSYCQLLMTWDDPAFRQEGLDWLSATNRPQPCIPRPGGPSRHGGTRRGH